MRKQRRRRGQATLESVIGVMVLSLLFFGLVQVAYIIMADMVAGHAANVTARSHIVGFERKIVKRAAEVGAIAMSGGIRNPAYRGMSNIQLGWLEPQLISEFLQSPGYTIDYERWPQLDLGL